jgi:hypothetical protein
LTESNTQDFVQHADRTTTDTVGGSGLYTQLHRRYRAGQYDNWRVWAGAVSIDIDGLRFAPTLARAYLRSNASPPQARVRCELFVAVGADAVDAGDIAARLRTDATGTDQPVRMRLRTDSLGAAEMCDANLVLESAPFLLRQTGAFSYTIEISADWADPPEWIPLNDIAPNPPGVIVVSPGWVAEAPTVTEVCLRKVDAHLRDGKFTSGRINHLTARLAQLHTDIIYLLPFFRPGLNDLHTGEDVRKGRLGSVYAVADFYELDPELVTPPEEADLAGLAAAELLREDDVTDVWDRFVQPAGPTTTRPGLRDLVEAGGRLAVSQWGRQRLQQLVGRAELRQLTRRAHELGKRVIFDLVLMQTSRDAALITQHPEWYVLDDEGHPQIHRIAWLVYSDVALLDLQGNQQVQDYLVEVAPYWMACCQLDGVRIDASQTVDRLFLQRLKNRIQYQDPEALVLGETLCALSDATDIPVDMVYALLVDFHRDAETATTLIDFLEQMHGTFAAATVALAYFENHDSPRATQVWSERYTQVLTDDLSLARTWRRRSAGVSPALKMAALKNLQATLINATAGMWPAAAAGHVGVTRVEPSGGTQLAWGIEWGSEWGEASRTDFENDTCLHPEARDTFPGNALVRAYECLAQMADGWTEARLGQVYYHRNLDAGGDAEDRVLAYTRYLDKSALLAVHNLDINRTRWVTISFDWLSWLPGRPDLVFDTYQALGLAVALADPDFTRQGLRVGVAPLQTRLFRLTAGAPLPRKE